MTKLADIHCPICNKPHTFRPENPFRPFCSERCKLIDLGTWADESNRLAGEAADPDEASHNEHDD